MTQHDTGLAGEEMAAAYLRARGLKIVQTRFRTRHGELDLVARDRGTLCFIEVKYRPEGRLGSGLESITPDKRRKLRGAVSAYLKDRPEPYRIGYLEITRAGVLYYDDILHEG